MLLRTEVDSKNDSDELFAVWKVLPNVLSATQMQPVFVVMLE